MPYFKVSLSIDLSVQLSAFVMMHDYLGPVPPSPLTYLPTGAAIDFPAPMQWPPGFAMYQNQLTTKTVHQMQYVCQAGHDVGVLIPHVQVAPSPSNSMTPLHIAFSSRASTISASTVLFDGKPVAACTAINLPPAPMITCGDPVSLPSSSAPTSHINTVLFKVTWTDYLIGMLTMAATLAVEAVCNKIPVKKLRKAFAGKLGKVGAEEFLEKAGDEIAVLTEEATEETVRALRRKVMKDSLAGNLVPDFSSKGYWMKQGIGAASGVAKLTLTEGPASVGVSAGSPYLKVGASGGRDAKGDATGGVSGQMGSPIASEQSSVGLHQEKGATAKASARNITGSEHSISGSSSGGPGGEEQVTSSYHAPDPADREPL